MQQLDLVFLNDEPRADGAHVAVAMDGQAVIHLAPDPGVPGVRRLADLLELPLYRHLIGFKRFREG